MKINFFLVLLALSTCFISQVNCDKDDVLKALREADQLNQALGNPVASLEAIGKKYLENPQSATEEDLKQFVDAVSVARKALQDPAGLAKDALAAIGALTDDKVVQELTGELGTVLQVAVINSNPVTFFKHIEDGFDSALQGFLKQCGGYGCYENYCWAYCGFNLWGGGWCYTTATSGYEWCNKNEDCNPCWSCVGICRF